MTIIIKKHQEKHVFFTFSLSKGAREYFRKEENSKKQYESSCFPLFVSSSRVVAGRVKTIKSDQKGDKR